MCVGDQVLQVRRHLERPTALLQVRQQLVLSTLVVHRQRRQHEDLVRVDCRDGDNTLTVCLSVCSLGLPVKTGTILGHMPTNPFPYPTAFLDEAICRIYCYEPLPNCLPVLMCCPCRHICFCDFGIH